MNSPRLVAYRRLCNRCIRSAELQITSTKAGVPEPRVDQVCESHRDAQVHDLTYLGYAVVNVMAAVA